VASSSRLVQVSQLQQKPILQGSAFLSFKLHEKCERTDLTAAQHQLLQSEFGGAAFISGIAPCPNIKHVFGTIPLLMLQMYSLQWHLESAIRDCLYMRLWY
jgi:hypothetical protein